MRISTIAKFNFFFKKLILTFWSLSLSIPSLIALPRIYKKPKKVRRFKKLNLKLESFRKNKILTRKKLNIFRRRLFHRTKLAKRRRVKSLLPMFFFKRYSAALKLSKFNRTFFFFLYLKACHNLKLGHRRLRKLKKAKQKRIQKAQIATTLPLLINHTRQVYINRRRTKTVLQTVSTKLPKLNRRTNFVREDATLRVLLLRWLSVWLGSPVSFFLDKALHHNITLKHLTMLAVLDFRISQYVSNGDITKLGLWTGGPNIVLFSALTRDPELLINWLRLRLPRMSLFSHRRFFRLLATLLSTLLLGQNKVLSGVNMYLVGKISVTGNAMSRSQLTRTGVGGNANLKSQAVSGFTLVHTNTGCLGLTITYFYL